MESEYSKFLSSIKLIASGIWKMKEDWDKASPRLLSLFEQKTWENIDKRVQTTSVIWASYGWVPLVPETSITEMLSIPAAPSSQCEADSIMTDKISNVGEAKLFSTLQTIAERQQLNSVTLNDSINCYENESYTACALCLFALIDERTIVAQPLSNSDKKRELARKATRNVLKSNVLNRYIFFVNTAQKIIDQLFLFADDFQKENSLNRNFLSHGMNRLIPDKIDCLKLFVLLFVVYESYESKLFSWSGKVDNA